MARFELIIINIWGIVRRHWLVVTSSTTAFCILLLIYPLFFERQLKYTASASVFLEDINGDFNLELGDSNFLTKKKYVVADLIQADTIIFRALVIFRNSPYFKPDTTIDPESLRNRLKIEYEQASSLLRISVVDSLQERAIELTNAVVYAIEQYVDSSIQNNINDYRIQIESQINSMRDSLYSSQEQLASITRGNRNLSVTVRSMFLADLIVGAQQRRIELKQTLADLVHVKDKIDHDKKAILEDLDLVFDGRFGDMVVYLAQQIYPLVNHNDRDGYSVPDSLDRIHSARDDVLISQLINDLVNGLEVRKKILRSELQDNIILIDSLEIEIEENSVAELQIDRLKREVSFRHQSVEYLLNKYAQTYKSVNENVIGIVRNTSITNISENYIGIVERLVIGFVLGVCLGILIALLIENTMLLKKNIVVVIVSFCSAVIFYVFGDLIKQYSIFNELVFRSHSEETDKAALIKYSQDSEKHLKGSIEKPVGEIVEWPEIRPYTIRLGVYNLNSDNGIQLLNELRSMGVSAFFNPISNQESHVLLTMGNFSSRDMAQKAIAKFRLMKNIHEIFPAELPYAIELVRSDSRNYVSDFFRKHNEITRYCYVQSLNSNRHRILLGAFPDVYQALETIENLDIQEGYRVVKR